jgi:hypothetical protein
MKEKKPPKSPAEYQKFLTPAQAALVIGVSIRTVYKYCGDDADPQIPHKRGPDGRIRITREDCERWLDEFKDRPRKPRNTKLKPTPSENR